LQDKEESKDEEAQEKEVDPKTRYFKDIKERGCLSRQHAAGSLYCEKEVSL
jgi:hypothetical protein